MTKALCEKCKKVTEHEHLHDAAHGIPETHMVGTERFECSECGHTTFKNDSGAEKFKFTLD